MEVPISLDELENSVNPKKTSTTKKKSSTRKKSRGTKPVPADKDNSIEVAATVPLVPLEQVYKVMHYYTRPNDTFSAVKREAQSDSELFNVNVRLIAHDHAYGTECGNCAAITK